METANKLPEHVRAARLLSALCSRLALSIESSPKPGNRFDGREPRTEPGSDWAPALRFSVRISRLGSADTVETDWGCGSGYPLSDFLRSPSRFRGIGAGRMLQLRESFRSAPANSVEGSEARAEIRAAFRPALSDVLPSLLSDVSSVSADRLGDGADWLDWASEFGALDGASPEQLRSLRDGYSRTCSLAPKLRKLLSPFYSRAEALSGLL
jgi:hypothetical protein